MNDKSFCGISEKTWAIIGLIVLICILVIFLIAPFLISLIIPFISPSSDVEHYQLVDTLDGVAIVLAITGTVASVASICMTFADHKRFDSEKKKTEEMFSSIDELHKEIHVVDSFVKRTFEQNKRLGLELYNNHIIASDPNQGMGISNNSEDKNASWGSKYIAGEIETDE